MVTLDRIRLTGLLPKAPPSAEKLGRGFPLLVDRTVRTSVLSGPRVWRPMSAELSTFVAFRR